VASVNLRPKMKEAIIAFADHFGASYKPEAEKLECGIRWFLEMSLTKIEAIANETNRYINYRKAEGFECSVLSELQIANAISKWKEKLDQ
jgi:hypothetical protein